ncbi:hypothetical protein BDW22DRAFT_1344169 [Trametopsis cervina]|nr:hypothetical protein BDW22DRAFT_1344169 [Trametopsis cervina]
MLFSPLFVVAQVIGACTATALHSRTEVDNFFDAIAVPLPGTVIQPGETYAFQYTGGSRCENLYTPVRIWLLSHQPALSDFDSTGNLMGSSLHDYGQFVTINIGELPVSRICVGGDAEYELAGQQNHTPIPTIPNNLTMPTLDGGIGEAIYLVTTQSEQCPVFYPTGFSAAYVPIQYGSV